MLSQEYKKTIIPALQKQLKGRNMHSIPLLTKVVLNYRVKEARESQEQLNQAIEELAAIGGQKPNIARAKKANASFKFRANDPLAVKVTLRGAKMLDFLEKFFKIVLPSLRDFKGINPASFDQSGNYNITIKDQTYFPEIDLNKVNKIRPVQITIGTVSSSKDEAKMLLSALGAKFADL